MYLICFRLPLCYREFIVAMYVSFCCFFLFFVVVVVVVVVVVGGSSVGRARDPWCESRGFDPSSYCPFLTGWVSVSIL